MGHRRIRIEAVGIAVIAASQLACSFIFVERAPENHKKLDSFDCTSSVAAPVVDTVWAGLNGAGSLIALGQSDADYAGRSVGRGATIGVGLAWLAVSGASAIYGYTHASTCREAKSELYSRLTERPVPVFPAPALAVPASQTAEAGCQKDTDCKGTRICDAGVCVEPHRQP